MDYLSRCYYAKMRPFFDSDDEVTVRWYFAPTGAKVYPGTHRFGSQVWREVADDPPDGPGELFGEKPYSSGYNPGYVGQCAQGPAEWYMNGLPRCCFIPPQPDWGARDGWRAFTVARPRDLLGGRGGWSGGSGGGSAAAWGGRGGFTGVCGRGFVGRWGEHAGMQGVAGLGSVGLWGGRDGWAGPAGRYVVGLWGGLGSFAGPGGTPVRLTRLRQQTAQSIPNNTSTAISWDTAVYDPFGQWSATHPTRLTAGFTGIYAVSVGFLWANTTSFYRVELHLNGTDQANVQGQFPGLGQGIDQSLPVTHFVHMNAGDYVEVNVNQQSGGSVPFYTDGSLVADPWCEFVFLGVEG